MLAQGYRHIITTRELQAAEDLLVSANLRLPEDIDSGLGFYEDGRLMGTAFLCGSLICGVCVDASQRGGGLSTSLVSRMVSEAMGKGLGRLCIFTKAEESDKFASLGFHLVAATPEAALLEFGSPLFDTWVTYTQGLLHCEEGGTTDSTNEQSKEQTLVGMLRAGRQTGAIVMNANPFTLGHRYLVEEAKKRCTYLLVFVVEEDASVFPFELRQRLVQDGLAGLTEVTVLPAGPYMVSRASFPAYFTSQADHARIHARLDATIFATRIAPAFGISKRFVGSEPYCRVTSLYNDTLHEILPQHGITVEEIERKTSSGEAISASRVRTLMCEEDYAIHPERFAALVPPSTLKIIRSSEGLQVAQRLREHPHDRH